MPDPVDLAALATCAGCGQTLRAATAGPIRRFYGCGCPACLIDADDLDEAIAAVVLDLLAPRVNELFTAESLRAGWWQATPAAQTTLAMIELAAITVTVVGDGFTLAVVGSPDLSNPDTCVGEGAPPSRTRDGR
ncbi:MAG: zinc ribbon domain-containing protein [Micromonosporaceae bacterium]|nr:zinc ribbon domain-containing protein [Micromonosporaceae bacterium]